MSKRAGHQGLKNNEKVPVQIMIPTSTLLAILAFFVVLGPLIFFHELGHFLASRWGKVTVEEFGIGLPPRAVTLFEQGGTKFTLNWLPLGGFNRLSGENDPAIEGGLAAATKWVRFVVLAAGSGANIIVAFILLMIMFMTGALEIKPGALIAKVEPGSPAENAGLVEGDIVIIADGRVIEQYSDLVDHINSHTGQPIALTIVRDSSTLELSITPRTNPPEGQGPTGTQVGHVGTEVRRYGFFAAIKRSGEEFLNFFQMIPRAVQWVREGLISPRFLRPVSIVGISQIGGQALDDSFEKQAAWPILGLAANISIALAFTNLLPLPAVDGGRIMFVLVEGIRGRRVDPQRETLVHFVGFALLLVLMLFLVYLDIVDPLITP
ncbi:MAG: site-2 protease family protein [Anaerolineae bacterium]|nr:site-2 protease family protein [Anaerolineae bacterium]